MSLQLAWKNLDMLAMLEDDECARLAVESRMA